MPFFDEIAKRSGQVIHFTSVSTGDVVRFPAFVTNFSDDYSIQWGSSAIFGRTDPIKSYQTTGGWGSREATMRIQGPTWIGKKQNETFGH